MSIPTSRSTEPANIFLDIDKCTGCGLCVEVCKDFSYRIVDHKVVKADKPIFGCVACGHCMMVCPTGVIAIEGRTLSPVQLFDLPDKSTAPTYNSLLAMLQRRRSVREFKDLPVEAGIINQYWTRHRQLPWVFHLRMSVYWCLKTNSRCILLPWNYRNTFQGSVGWLPIGLFC